MEDSKSQTEVKNNSSGSVMESNNIFLAMFGTLDLQYR